MIQALNDNAFTPFLTPEALWRASCSWAAGGMADQAEWLHEMAVDLIEIGELPTTEREPVGPQPIGYDILGRPLYLQQEAQALADADNDIPF